VKIHDYNICCTYQFPCLNTAAAGAAAVAAGVIDTDCGAGDQQVVLRLPVVGSMLEEEEYCCICLIQL
jgi:hypothetical protein